MSYRSLIPVLLLVLSALSVSAPAWAKLTIYSQIDVGINLIVYNGLNESSLFKGRIVAKTTREIDTPYSGLALLVFSGGQSYPVIIGDVPLTLRLTGPNIPPSFTPGTENDLFYKLLSGNNAPVVSTKQLFATLMIQAKLLLESSHNIHTTTELSAKKKEFHEFFFENYSKLQHSDMIRRLIAQYFMMHEYINYHVEGAPATDIQAKYQQAVVGGVENWIHILQPHIPDHEILNYCVALFYNRSMVSLASLIMNAFKDIAYCPGSKKTSLDLPDNLPVTNTDRNILILLGKIDSNKVIAFVSEECPVSMVATIIEARKLAAQKSSDVLIVAPLEKLSERHLSMNRMISGGNILFINDENWSKENLAKELRLPLSRRIGDTVE